MQAAKDNFDIPLILSPENLASPDLDELSGMTYLSYFMKVDSPGYFATLGWTRKMIPHKNVNNFQVVIQNRIARSVTSEPSPKAALNYLSLLT